MSMGRTTGSHVDVPPVLDLKQQGSSCCEDATVTGVVFGSDTEASSFCDSRVQDSRKCGTAKKRRERKTRYEANAKAVHCKPKMMGKSKVARMSATQQRRRRKQNPEKRMKYERLGVPMPPWASIFAMLPSLPAHLRPVDEDDTEYADYNSSSNNTNQHEVIY